MPPITTGDTTYPRRNPRIPPPTLPPDTTYPFPPLIPLAPGQFPPQPPVPRATLSPTQLAVLTDEGVALNTPMDQLDDLVKVELLRLCAGFDDLFFFGRTMGQEMSRVLDENMNTLLHLQAARYLDIPAQPGVPAQPTEPDTLDFAKEILVYQRWMTQSKIPKGAWSSIQNTIYEYVDDDTGTFQLQQRDTLDLKLRELDIPQLKQNHEFFRRFSRFYQDQLSSCTYQYFPQYSGRRNPEARFCQLKNESQIDYDREWRPLTRTDEDSTLEFEVQDHLSVKDFYNAWLTIYRFKYEPIETFIARGSRLVDPKEVGRIHFIAFLMDQFYMSQVPFLRRSAGRVGSQNEIIAVENSLRRKRIMAGWRHKCLMGVWYPLKPLEKKKLLDKILRPPNQDAGFPAHCVHILYWKCLAHLSSRQWNQRTDAQKAAPDDETWIHDFLEEKRLFDADFYKAKTDSELLEVVDNFKLSDY